MTEATQMPVQPTYEQVRDSLPDKYARTDWVEADKMVEYARQDMARVADDPELSDEGKKARAQAVIDRHADKIKERYATARERAQAAAESSWEFSVPMPGGLSLANTKIEDSSELIAIQNEAAALAHRIETSGIQAATKAVSQNPDDDGVQENPGRVGNTLKAEFDEAMRVGGTEGKIRALAVRRVCESMGVPFDDVVDRHRTERHVQRLQDARRLETARLSIPSGKGVAQNPYENQRGPKAVGTYCGRSAVLGSKPDIFGSQKRRKSWK